ncbi:N-acetylglucosamine kinase [Facklamia miroungae]|uniref:BadF-type ATPase n=1 Tax=Facklamia miroungae TaxID=120956 RepID=A0A1G7RWI5_9LACT|nr:BadF/BadG/BcrA/BcrD ATPase family protein [Facklamia miroungae]NKZ29249.1 hypothetical protein [Facklamia miroungae]SDG15101.1 BadF-type ATPase [Facklamia miroungae]
MYFICVDGGGTKTQFALYSNWGTQIDVKTLPTCHILQTTEEKAIKILQQGIFLLLKGREINESDLVLSLGLGGYGSSNNRGKIEKIVQLVTQNRYPYFLTNDAEIALLGAHNGQRGAILIAGTGSICLFFDGEHTIRSGGWGYLFGDEGSAFWIGQKMLNRFAKEADNRTAKTEIYTYLMRKYQLTNPHDILDELISTNKNSRTIIGNLAKDVVSMANQGSQESVEIIKDAAAELASLVNESLSDYDSVNLAIYGGLWKAGEILLNYFSESLDSHIKVCEPKGDACRGAFIYAKKQLLVRGSYEQRTV